MLILKGKILLLQVNGSHLHGNCIFYTVHCTLYIVGICESGISNKKRRKVYLLEKYETSTCINSITSNSYISINGRFTVLEVISVMWSTIIQLLLIIKLATITIKTIIITILTFKLRIYKFISTLLPFKWMMKFCWNRLMNLS